jgi:hypothetical protein
VLTDRLDDWLDKRADSFQRGEVHEENLRYLLGSDFVTERAWEQGVACFEHVMKAGRDWQERLLTRLVVPLTDTAALVAEPIETGAIPSHVSHTTPPMLVVMPPDLAVDHRRFEQYRVALPFEALANVLAVYVVARSLDSASDDVWSRYVELEHF